MLPHYTIKFDFALNFIIFQSNINHHQIQLKKSYFVFVSASGRKMCNIDFILLLYLFNISEVLTYIFYLEVRLRHPSKNIQFMFS